MFYHKFLLNAANPSVCIPVSLRYSHAPTSLAPRVGHHSTEGGETQKSAEAYADEHFVLTLVFLSIARVGAELFWNSLADCFYSEITGE